MKTTFRKAFILPTAVFLLVASPMITFADDPSTSAEISGEQEKSTFSTPAQANAAAQEAEYQNAAQTAIAANLANTADLTPAEVAEALSKQGLTDYDDNISIDQAIAEMRASGMGWGQIAQAIGVHPSAIGLGHRTGAMNQNREQNRAGRGIGKHAGMMSSTARDTKTGGAANFGQSKAGKGKGANNAGGLGKAAGKDNQGAGKGNSGGKGGDKGGGNSGGGNGGGKK